MPVFVSDCHFLNDLLHVLVSRFNGAVHLQPVGRRVMMMYLELFTEIGDHCVVEIRTIVSNNSLWHTISINQIMSDKSRYDVLAYCSKGSRLNPLREVINSY